MDNGKPREGQLCRLVIDGYASDGAGVARLDGMVVFVQGGIRGEACDVRLTHVGRSALWGRVEEVVNPSPARIFPRCLHYTKCGGCQFRHMNYAEELEAKRIRVEDALRRLGGAEIHVSAILGAEQVDRYRNKAQFPVAKGPRIGFYRPRSHDVIDVDDCLLQGEAAARLRGAVKEWMAEYSIPAYNERTFTGLVRHVYVRTNRAGRSLCCLLVNGRGVPREVELVRALRRAEPNLAGIVLGVNEKHNNVILGGLLPHPVGGGLPVRHPVRPHLPAVRPLLLSGQPGPDRGALRQGPGVRRPHRGGDGAGSLLRHRHHQPGHGPEGGHGVGGRGGAPGGGRRHRQRPAQPH